MADRGRLAPAGAALGVALALALAGCASLAPRYERPPAPIPASYPIESVPAATSAEAAASIDWRRFYADPRLVELIERALANNRDLRVAALNIEQTRALYDVRRAEQLPSVGAGATVSRQPGGLGGVVTTYAVGLAATSYELDLFGRVRSLADAALEQYLATEETRRAVQVSLIGSVAATYIAMLAHDELVRVTQQTLATREESARLTKLRFDAGASSELDFQQSISLLEGARVALAQALRQRAQDQNALQLLVGGPLPADLPAPRPLAGVLAGVDPPPGLPSELLERRPDIRAAERQLLAANANIGAARAAFFPRISLTGTFGSASTELSGLFKSGSWAFTGTGQLVQPLLEWGRNRANLEVARAAFEIARAQYERSIQSAFREVADALAGRATFGEQLRAQRAQVDALAAAYRLADLRYRGGVASYLDALDAQRSLFVAQQALVQTEAARLQNAVTLYRVLGGGWSDADAAAAR